MKKLAASILLLIYFVVSTGFVVSVHYCMDRINAVQLGHVDSDECGECGMLITENDGCCKDDIKVLKMHVDQTIYKLVQADFSLPLVSSAVSDFLFVPLYTEKVPADPVAHAPPLSRQDTYLQNCVFRI